MESISNYKRIHCLGIGGIGLSAVAEILQNNGHIVSGTDLNETDVTRHLESVGIRVVYEHRADNVDGVDAVVYSAAVSAEKPEMVRAKELGIPCFSRAEVLGMIMEHYKNSVAICGTHGKTTVTSMTSLILRNAKYKPTILVGGNLDEINGNVEIGENEYFVTEACEYMDSFLHLRPRIGVLLNIDSDHLDYFKDIDHIVSSFDKFAQLVPASGTIIAYDANPFVNQVIRDLDNVVTFGLSENCDYYAANIQFNEEGMPAFDVCHDGQLLSRVQLAVPGEHNILNALAAFTCACALGVEPQLTKETLERYHGTQRRFDIVGTTAKGVKIVDDYAHHPTEIKATLSASENVPHNKLWCIFQPHTYTRTIALFDEFAEAFEKADKLILAEIYAAREKNIYKISSAQLAEKIKETHPHKEVLFMEDFAAIADYVDDQAQRGDMVITMGAGDIYKVGEMLLER